MSTGVPRVVCFDLGGVVVRICRTWEEACRRAGIDVREPERFGAPELARRRHELVERYQTGRLACAEYWSAIAEASSGVYTAPEIEAIHCAWTMDEYPGVASLVARLNQRDALLTACLSNTNASHWNNLASSPAIAALRRRLVSHELRLSKPDPEIYRAAERALEAQPQEIVFFDDLRENVDAAVARGWRAFQIDHTGDTAAQMREHLGALGIDV